MNQAESRYIHGTHVGEQDRLTLMNRAINEPALRQLDLRGGERILDVGCGLAQLTRTMARQAGVNAYVLGIERDPDQLAEAEGRAKADGESGLVELRRGDAQELPLRADEWESFDLVHARFVLEHVDDPMGVVRQMVRAARLGGRIVVQDDDHDLMRFWPAIPRMEKAWLVYASSYTSLGTDPIVGRRLVELLYQAGAEPTFNTWLFYGACSGNPLLTVLCENLSRVIDGARETIVATSDLVHADVDEALAEFKSWGERPDAALWYCVCWAEGRKP